MIFCVKKEFHDEMRLEFDRRAKASDSLTKKATNLMVIAGVVSAVLFGFQTPSLEFEQEKIILSWSHLIWISVGLLIISIISCIILNNVEIQKTPFLGENFLDDSGKVDLKIMKEWTSLCADKYYEELSKVYIECLVQSERVIESKSKLLNCSVIFFLSGLISAPILLAISALL